MNQAYKAIYNREYDNRMQYAGDRLSKPASTDEQLVELKALVAERKANGTLGKVPFVLEAVSNPYISLGGKWSVSLTYSDGITRRKPEVSFQSQEEAQDFYTESLTHIGEPQR